MRIQKVQNSTSPTFGAKLEIEGYIGDISTKQLRAWEKKAKFIGNETDIIHLTFGKPIDMDVRKNFPKPDNPAYLRSWKRRLTRMFGVNAHMGNFFVSKRAINASVTINDGTNIRCSDKIACGYWSNYASSPEAELLKEWHKNETKNAVNNYLKKLKSL